MDLLTKVINRLEDVKHELGNALASGVSITNYEAYSRMVGRREGVLRALEVINHVLTEQDERINKI